MESVPVKDRKAETLPTKPRLTRNQKRSFLAAWGGWAMDGMDSFIYALVLVPALRELLPRSGIEASQANVGFYGSLLFALFMVGWGLAMLWGPVDNGQVQKYRPRQGVNQAFLVGKPVYSA